MNRPTGIGVVAAPSSNVAASPASAAALILIVDGDSRSRKLLQTMLRPEGYRTHCAGSGAEALEAITRQSPDLILLDVMMPGMDGYALARLLKASAATANIPIIMITAQSDADARLAGLDAGAEEFLAKPVLRAELWLRVRNLLRLKAFGDFLRDYSNILEREVQTRTVDLQRFRTAMDATADGIMLVSRRSMEFVEVNAAACSMLGYSRREIFGIGPAALSLSSPADLGAAYDAIIAGRGSSELTESHLLRKDGTRVEIEVQRQAQRVGADWIIVAIVRDITERKEAQKRLLHLAHYDALTGLPNRTLFYETLEKTLTLAQRDDCQVAVLFLDLDHFKNINDTLGHAVGDELLRQVSNRLEKCVRVRDTVGRLGGDEFALILMLQEGPQGATLVADKIREALRLPYDMFGDETPATASIGITLFPDDALDPETLIKFADTAMYRAKQAGRDTFCFFTAQMNVEVLARHDMEAALRRAVDNNEFVLYYQPKVGLDSGAIAGLEALLRWERPGHGLVSPAQFIPLLEETGLIVRVGAWVINEACRQMRQWLGSPIGRVKIAVNVSSRQFAEGDLEADVVNALDAHALAADLLELELTEGSLMANTGRTVDILKRLKKRGVQISIDDFGTGYSSLAYLRRFPIDRLKIDIAFIRDITTNRDDAAIALTIIRMAHSLRLGVVAEGVETPAQLAYLRRHRCDQIQGYLFSKPLPAAEIQKMLLTKKNLTPTRFELALDQLRNPPRTLLLVDDEPEILRSLSRLLRPYAFNLLTAESGEQALQVLAEQHVDAIISDQRMPGMTGVAFLSIVRERYPDVVRMILSGYADLESVTTAINQGAVYKFITKPWDDDQLAMDIQEAFQHKSMADENYRLGRELMDATNELALVTRQLELASAHMPAEAVDQAGTS